MKRLQKLTALGIEMPKISLAQGGNFTFSTDDVLVLDDDDRITLSSIFRTAAFLEESIAQSYERTKKYTDFSVVPFRLNFMLFSEKNHVKALTNQWVLPRP